MKKKNSKSDIKTEREFADQILAGKMKVCFKIKQSSFCNIKTNIRRRITSVQNN